MANLTKRFIDTIEPQCTPRSYADSGKGSVEGLRLKVQPSGNKSWNFRYWSGKYKNNRKHYLQTKIGDAHALGLEEARNMARKVAKEVAGVGSTDIIAKTTEFKEKMRTKEKVLGSVEDLIKDYLSDCDKRNTSTLHDIERRLTGMPRWLLSKEARIVKWEDIQNAIQSITDSPASSNILLAYIKAAFN